MKIVLAQINPIIGDLRGNQLKIISYMDRARQQSADLILFPEMALCGYPPEDLLLLPSFIEAIAESLNHVIEASKGICTVIGTVRKNPSKGEKGLYNSAAIINDGALIGFQDKILLPDYDVFSERRYFDPGDVNKTWNLLGKRIGITICEDIWQHAGAVHDTNYSRDPVKEIKRESPDLLLNLSASPYYLQRHETRLNVCLKAVETLKCPLLFCNQIGGNDSLIFDGYSMHMDQDAKLVDLAKGFEEDFLIVDLEEKKECIYPKIDPIRDLFNALVLGVRDYFHKQGFQKACFGLSGGIDSAIVACIAASALGSENILALLLPSRFSSKEGIQDSETLVSRLKINSHTLSIEKPFISFLQLLEPSFSGLKWDVTEENLQARIRGMIIMAFSNKFGFIALGTGNKSEMAMGYTTLYGDMCGGLGVLSDVTKEQVYALARWINRQEEIIPHSIIERAPSAELRENQKDTDALPGYPIVDVVLKSYVEDHLSPEEIALKNNLSLDVVQELVFKIHCNEYKRRQAPPGLRVTKKAFSIGRRFPIVQKWNME